MRRQLANVLVITMLSAVLVPAHVAHSGPIIKPKKYHGPIPRNAFTIRTGFLGGASNEEMILFLDGPIKPPFEGESTDFSSSTVMIDLTYTHKVHPQFAVRANTSVAFLRSSGDGFYVPRTGTLPDTLLAPVVDYVRHFDVDLFVFELSAMYFFEDASVQEFQPYVGGGFSIGFPHAKFLEDRVLRSTSESIPYESDKWSTLAGVHGLIGAYYYLTNRFALTGEARVHILQSKYPLTTKNEDDLPEEVKLDVDYSGFYLSVGVSRAF